MSVCMYMFMSVRVYRYVCTHVCKNKCMYVNIVTGRLNAGIVELMKEIVARRRTL
jgi:hypothetical protein